MLDELKALRGKYKLERGLKTNPHLHRGMTREYKPIIVGEMASDEMGGSKAQWIDAIIPTLKIDFPLIKAFVRFDIDKERHWQINSSAAALAAYARLAKDPFMNP